MGIISKPNPTTNGTTADGSAVSANFDTIYSEFNGSIDNANIKPNAGIVDTKLATISTAGKVSSTAITSTFSNLATVTLTATTINATTITATTLNATTIETVAWADYGATSSIIGWSSYTNSNIFTKKIGKTVFVSYVLNGSSNSTSTNFTLQYANASGIEIDSVCSGANTGSALTTSCKVLMANASTQVNFYSGMTNLLTWSQLGLKYVIGQFFYESA